LDPRKTHGGDTGIDGERTLVILWWRRIDPLWLPGARFDRDRMQAADGDDDHAARGRGRG